MTPDAAWELIEQDLIPSCREDTRTDFYELLADIWDEGNHAFQQQGFVAPNPYRASEGE